MSIQCDQPDSEASPNAQRFQCGPGSKKKRRRIWLKRAAVAAMVVPLAYLLAALAGMTPANREFEPTPGGVSIYVLSNGVHTDIITPAVSGNVDWTKFLPLASFPNLQRPSSHVQFGWGDRAFYIETPTWNDVRISTVVKSMFCSTSSVMHVSYVNQPSEWSHCRRIDLSAKQYSLLTDSLRDSFDTGEYNLPIGIPGVAYHARDAFFVARGNYHVLHTCNCWTGDVLRNAGIRCGIWTPWTTSVMWTLPKME